jgi:hypothetical protein
MRAIAPLLGRLARMARWRLIRVTHPEKGTGNRNALLRIIIHAEGVFIGVLGSRRYHPRRRRAVWFSIIRAGARTGRELPGWRDALKLVAEIEEVVLADTQFRHFLDHWQKIGQRTNGAQRWGIGRPH